MEALHEEERHGLKIKIFQDQCEDSPQDWGDDNLFLTAYHRQFSIDGPRRPLPKEQWKVSHKSACTECGQRNFTTVEETGKKCGRCGADARVNRIFYSETQGGPIVSKDETRALLIGKKEAGEDYPADLAKKYHVFGLEAYIHSGVVLALSQEGDFPDRRWDVSQLGAVFVAKEEWKRRDSARKAALGLIQSWNDALSGNVYGYRVETIPAGDEEEGEELESCWGFYGDYDSKHGALAEARAVVDRLTSKGKTDGKGQTLLPLA